MKFNIGDKVRTITNLKGISCLDGFVCTIKEIIDIRHYVVEQENGLLWTVNEEDLELIEQDTKEETPKEKCERCLESYEILQNNHLEIEELKEELGFAIMAIKMLTQLLKVDDSELL